MATAEVRVNQQLIFEKGVEGRHGINLESRDVPRAGDLPRRKPMFFKGVQESTVVQHYTSLGNRNINMETAEEDIDLGSCTMKYNPKLNDAMAALDSFAWAHPYQEIETVQGAMEIMYELHGMLAVVGGMDAVSLTPRSGAHGEFAAGLMIRACQYDRGQGEQRRIMLVPDSAHGTNPATAAMAGFEVLTINTKKDGNMDIDQLAKVLKEDGENVAGLMFTQPSTWGYFDPNMPEISEMVHKAGGLVFVDGANLNALLGKAELRAMGADCHQINLHKTFSTPHGGGGPGSGPICATAELAPFLPGPVVRKNEINGLYEFAMPEKSIGRLAAGQGNWGMLIRAYTYILSLGADGLREVSESAVVNANHLLVLLMDHYKPAVEGRTTMHEAVFAGLRDKSAKTQDVVKRLVDKGSYPTVYFPLNVDEAIMAEPTESMTKEGIEHLADSMIEVAIEAVNNPDILHTAPHRTPVGRLDEATAARKPVLRWRPEEPKAETQLQPPELV